MMRSPRFSLCLACCLLPLGCGDAAQQAKPPAPTLDSVPEAFVTDAAIPAGSSIAVHGSEVTLRRSALNKTFLLHPALMLATEAPSTWYLKSRVVTFHAEGETLGLFDVNPGAIYPSFATERLIRTFAITAHDADTITFRWNLGLRDVQLQDPYVASDAVGVLTTTAPLTLEVTDSYLAAMAVRGDTLELQQIATLRMSPTELVTAHLVCRLAPLGKSTTDQFEPRLSTRQRDIGYFEVDAVRPGDGGTDFYAMRWDTSAAPVTYAIVAGVPADIEAAIREGVLYWNAVAGRTLVRVEGGADPLAPPPYGHVLIRWVPYTQASYAYASVQVNPLTGAIVAGEIYLPSAWSSRGKMHMQNSAPSASMCQISSAALTQATASLHDPATLRRGMQDTVRAVVAHETGHTLGLRHNFAASTQTTLDNHTTLHAVLGDYLHRADHPGAHVASSVMDYNDPVETLLLGAHIRHTPLPYDQAAIAWGYDTSPEPLPAAGPFCTDMEALKAAATGLWGCKAHDSGRNPIDGLLGQLILARRQLAQAIVNHLLDLLAPEYPGDWLSMSDVMEQTPPEIFTTPMHRMANSLLLELSEEARTLLVRRQLAADGSRDEHVEKRQAQQQLRDWLEEVGGLPGFLLQAYGIENAQTIHSGWLREEVDTRLEELRPLVTGEPQILTPDAMQSLTHYASYVADEVEQVLLRDLIAGMTQGPDLPDELRAMLPADSPLLNMFKSAHTYDPRLINAAWSSSFGDIAQTLILSTQADAAFELSGSRPAMALPRYRTDLRVAAVALLSPKVFGQPTAWQAEQRLRLSALLLQRLAPLVTQETDLLGATHVRLVPGLPEALQTWAEDEMQVLNALAALGL